jgi:hypothetical protein
MYKLTLILDIYFSEVTYYTLLEYQMRKTILIEENIIQIKSNIDDMDITVMFVTFETQ